MNNMNKAKTLKKRFPSYLLAAALGAVGAAPALWLAPAAQAAEEGPQRVAADKVPDAARNVLESEARDSHELEFLRIGPHEYAAHYTKPYHLRLELRVSDDGRILSRTETKNQPELKGERAIETARAEAAREEQARQAGAQALADRQARESERLARANLPNIPVDQGWRDVGERDTYYRQHQEDLDRLEAEARREKVVNGADARQMSEEWNASRLFPVWRDRLPEGVRATFAQETIGTRDISYYRYIVGDQTYYSAHFALAGGQRTEVRVDAAGKLLGKRDLTAAEENRVLGRDRQLQEQWRGRDAARPDAVRPDAHLPAVASGKTDKINPEEAPAAIRDAVRRETRTGKSVEYYRINVPGRDNDQYIVGYTDDSGRRMHIYLSANGTVLERRELKDGQERR